MIKRSIILSALIYITSTPLVANISMKMLLSKTSFEYCNEKLSTGILLAGGLTKDADSKMDWSALNGESLKRTIYLASKIDNYNLKTIIISGGSGGKVKEADIMANLLMSFSEFQSINIIVDNLSKNTSEVLTFLKKINISTLEPMLLITSDWHMPRAQAIYNKTIRTCPLPSGSSYIPFGFPGWFIPQQSAILKLEQVWHELIGIIYANSIPSKK
jgi:uncharacterized SAM-binding protein YcdF (DUF218 family)